MSPAHVGLPCATAGLPSVAAGGTRAAPAFGVGAGLAQRVATLWSCRNAPSSVRWQGGPLNQLTCLVACQFCTACRGKRLLCLGACSGIVASLPVCCSTVTKQRLCLTACFTVKLCEDLISVPDILHCVLMLASHHPSLNTPPHTAPQVQVFAALGVQLCTQQAQAAACWTGLPYLCPVWTLGAPRYTYCLECAVLGTRQTNWVRVRE